MQKLSDILYRVNLVEVIGNTSVEVNNICFDSRKVASGNVFVATRGTAVDGHKFINSSIEKGAIAIICEEIPAEIKDEIVYVKVRDASSALGFMADNFFNQPSSKMKVIAITGTNGKTTVATLLFRLFSNLGYKCGLISTVENMIDGEIIPSTHTTPDAVQLNKLMAEMVEKNCAYCFMEASSHAIHQNRMVGINVSGAVFTNLTRDHLDYHKTFDDYIAAKKKLFDGLSKDSFALSNADDKRGAVMLQNSKAKKLFYSLRTIADFTAKILENTFDGLILSIDGSDVHTQLVGDFNAYNLLAVYATARLLGVEKMDALVSISQLKPAEGRFDYVISEKEKITGIVDYAHTPDALEKVLTTLKTIRTGNETLFTIIGCGGDRDKGKRPMMAKVAYDNCDMLVLTSDNPRSENADEILNDMKEGIRGHKVAKVLSIADRREAIKVAASLAKRGDIILLAGKGHEKYQEIKGEKFPFDDKKILAETFKSLNK